MTSTYVASLVHFLACFFGRMHTTYTVRYPQFEVYRSMDTGDSRHENSTRTD